MLEETLVAFLADLAPVYPTYLPERATKPAITLRRVSTVRQENHDGDSGLVTVRFQLMTHTATHPEALELGRLISRRLLNQNGPLGAFDQTNNVTVENELDLGFEAEAETWTYTLDAILNAKE